MLHTTTIWTEKGRQFCCLSLMAHTCTMVHLTTLAACNVVSPSSTLKHTCSWRAALFIITTATSTVAFSYMY